MVPVDLAPGRVAGTAGLTGEVHRLKAELQRQQDELTATRARLAAAVQEERDRIARNLHDGAQQSLVSIGLALRHVQHELGPGAPCGGTLDRAIAEIGTILQELRELARGGSPPQLDAGLAVALRDLADRSPLPVSVEATTARFPEHLEVAAYFVAAEGLTNAVKHASASSVSLSGDRRGRNLVVRIEDDGIGGAAPGAGSGLNGMLHRVRASGGTLRIESERGAGTRLTAELPCEW